MRPGQRDPGYIRPEAAVPRWPLSFRANYGTQITPGGNPAPTPQWWSHTLYRGPDGQPPKVLYAKTKAESEAVAQEFLKEAVLGFKMERTYPEPYSTRLQDKVSMIQIASESKIGLFHIGIHEGQTTDDIIAPSLRKIIESPDIVKVGVKIFIGDANLLCLRIHLKLESRGAFELSHLYRLITFGSKWPNYIMTYLQALGKQVQEILGLPLNKDPSVRMSNWNQPLSAQQRLYAADDAYAGLMLYHCMNATRANMLPVPPPLPVLMEYYPVHAGQGFAPAVPIVVQGPMTAAAYFRLPHPALTVAQVVRESGLTPDQKELYTILVGCSNGFFLGYKNSPKWIPQHRMLIEMARLQPRTLEGILSIQGMQESQAKKFGTWWLNTIYEFVTEFDDESEQEIWGLKGKVWSLKGKVRSLKRKAPSASSGKPEVRAVSSLHTGLSFAMDQTTIDTQGSDEDSDDAPTSPRVKRTRSENDRSTLGQTAAAPILIEDSDDAESSKAQAETQQSSGPQGRGQAKIAWLWERKRKAREQIEARKVQQLSEQQGQGQSKIDRIREIKRKGQEARMKQAEAYRP
ncbi:ribonuclease H-like domain-containing protein [Pestalotiopsis sp. NC0098]|nr:ribonuclease H-like domain-containing protein [Pestalotiopsis sp. NC0098]